MEHLDNAYFTGFAFKFYYLHDFSIQFSKDSGIVLCIGVGLI